MDLRLREITLRRLLLLLVWTLLVILKRGISALIESIEGCVFEKSEPPLDRKVERGEVRGATLLPPLSDEFLFAHIWPRLHQRVNISLLWRLRRVNRAWKSGVETTREWAALELVCIDSPGFIKYLVDHRECRPSLRKQVESELESINFLFTECLEDYAVRSETEDVAESDDFDRWSSSTSSVDGPDYLFLRSDYPKRRNSAF